MIEIKIQLQNEVLRVFQYIKNEMPNTVFCLAT